MDKDGVPLITVVAGRRDLIELITVHCLVLLPLLVIVPKKVLYIPLKNKFCCICNRTENVEHVCYKNYEGSSTGMEAQNMVEGFKRREGMYGIRYCKLIADGDSNTYKKILEAHQYNNCTVEKIIEDEPDSDFIQSLDYKLTIKRVRRVKCAVSVRKEFYRNDT